MEKLVVKKLRKKIIFLGLLELIIYHHIPKTRLTTKYIIKRMINQSYSDSYQNLENIEIYLI